MTFKKLNEILSTPDKTKEIYLTDKYRRNQRKGKGHYSKDEQVFDFIYLIQSWEKIVGKMLCQNTRPLKIIDKTLFIMVKHPIFAQELKFMTQMIVDKIIEYFPNLKQNIARIKFINSEAFFKPLKDISDQENKLPPPSMHPFNPAFQMKKAHASKLFDDIEDDSLREIFISLYLQN